VTTVARRLRETLQLLEDLVPISEAHEQAKREYAAALESGDPARIAEAKTRKDEAARRLRETRFWLRGENWARTLSDVLAETERTGAARTAAQVRAELERLEQRLAPIRDALAAFAETRGGDN